MVTDPEVLDQLHRDHAKALWAYAVRLTGDERRVDRAIRREDRARIQATREQRRRRRQRCTGRSISRDRRIARAAAGGIARDLTMRARARDEDDQQPAHRARIVQHSFPRAVACLQCVSCARCMSSGVIMAT